MMRSSSQPISKTIGLVVFPLRNPDEECGRSFISQLATLLAPLVGQILIITGNLRIDLLHPNVRIINVKAPIVKSAKGSAMSKMLRLLLAQFTLSSAIIQQSKKLDVIMFYLSAGLLPLPMLLARILGKKLVIINTGSGSQSLRRMYPGLPGRIYSAIIRGMEHIEYSLANKIVVYYKSMIAAIGLERYRDKVVTDTGKSPYITRDGYIDTRHFVTKQGLNDRGNIVGYVGRLTGEKGVIEFATAIPLILLRRPDTRFLVVGDGPLIDKMKTELTKDRCLEKVEFTGWKPRQELPDLLNKMRFIIVPSYTEVVAFVALEAMACGTICIANPVGATEDVIIDGKTGFLLKDNQPSTIADRVIEVWFHTKLNEIQENARAFVTDNFTYEKVQESWRVVLGSLDI